MNMPSINIQIIITLNSMHKGKTMSVQPVEISKAYRLLQVGSTTMISAKYDGVENVMSAAAMPTRRIKMTPSPSFISRNLIFLLWQAVRAGWCAK